MSRVDLVDTRARVVPAVMLAGLTLLVLLSWILAGDDTPFNPVVVLDHAIDGKSTGEGVPHRINATGGCCRNRAKRG